MSTRGARRALQAIVILTLWGLLTHGTFAGTGDEPHYLAIAHSIAFDNDLDLANNYGANEPLVGGGVLQPEAHLRAGVDGTMRPVHDVGMPLLLSPAVRVLVPLTNVLARAVPPRLMQRARLNPPVLYRHFLSLVMAWLAMVLAGLMFDAFIALGATPLAAFGAAALLALSPPLLIFSILLFTELLSALLCFAVFSAIALKDERGAAYWWWIGAATGFLVLVHARNAGLMLPLAALGAYHLRDRARRSETLAFAAGIGVMVAVRTVVNDRFWGSLISGPHARTGDWPGLAALVTEMTTRKVGLLVDQEFGLLIYAPIYIVALAGAAAIWTRRRDVTLAIAVVALFYVTLIICPITNVHGWTGGWNPAARFLTPIAPLLGVLVFAGLRALPRAASIPIVALQIVISAYAWQHPKLLWNDGDGRAALCDVVGDRVCDRLPALARRSPAQSASRP
jgi:hypothetical protein